MLSRLVGLFFLSLGGFLLLHNFIRVSPVLIPFSLVVQVVAIVFSAIIFGLSLAAPAELERRGIPPQTLVIGCAVMWISALIGVVIAWVN